MSAFNTNNSFNLNVEFEFYTNRKKAFNWWCIQSVTREDTWNLKILNLQKIAHIVDVERTVLSPLSLVQNIVILVKTEINKNIININKHKYKYKCD